MKYKTCAATYSFTYSLYLFTFSSLTMKGLTFKDVKQVDYFQKLCIILNWNEQMKNCNGLMRHKGEKD